jgi:hypothetical protein
MGSKGAKFVNLPLRLSLPVEQACDGPGCPLDHRSTRVRIYPATACGLACRSIRKSCAYSSRSICGGVLVDGTLPKIRLMSRAPSPNEARKRSDDAEGRVLRCRRARWAGVPEQATEGSCRPDKLQGNRGVGQRVVHGYWIDRRNRRK